MVIGHALDEFIGIWSKDDERKFNDAIQAIEKIDESLWR